MSPRIVIVGGPKTGKTTTAKEIGGEITHTDDLMHGRDWSQQSSAAAEQLGRLGDWTMEGITAVRALRKWMQIHPGEKPCDEVVHLTQPHGALTPGQVSLTKACDTVFREIEPELRRRGVAIK